MVGINAKNVCYYLVFIDQYLLYYCYQYAIVCCEKKHEGYTSEESVLLSSFLLINTYSITESIVLSIFLSGFKMVFECVFFILLESRFVLKSSLKSSVHTVASTFDYLQMYVYTYKCMCI